MRQKPVISYIITQSINQSINKKHLLGHQLPVITGAVQVTQ